ncbi:DUF1120 domain-containing protein [Enterobacter sp. UNJFSC 003]|uniref:DUF1120 domain-containing protein n=1 Tax=Enterobacter sp. UNJFSC 003 TaxID=3122077 RepID=UPI002EC7F342|nr:DUF1120 domain-containing protein [Serratia liquefaciens]
MKKILLATALSLCVSSAFAASTAVMKVTGTLTNSACTPELSGGGVVDYGYIRLGELSADSVNQLGKKNIDFTINCTVATKVAFFASDDRSSSKANVTVLNATAGGADITAYDNYYFFGVGETADGMKIGNYTLYVKDTQAVADGVTVDVVGQNQGWNENTWRKGSSIRADGVYSGTVAQVGTTTPIAFKTATFPLVTTLAIQDTNTLGITDDTKLDGQATITLRYL